MMQFKIICLGVVMTDVTCAIWGTPAKRAPVKDGYSYFSERAGGEYTITQELIEDADFPNLDHAVKDRLTTWILNKNQEKITFPLITQDVLDAVNSKKSMGIDEKIRRFFVFLNSINTRLGTQIINTGRDDAATFVSDINEKVKIYAELINETECIAFKNVLDEMSCFNQYGGLSINGMRLLESHAA